MKRLTIALLSLALAFAVSGWQSKVEAGGTGGLAIPTGVFPDSSGLFVGFVTVMITKGWVNTPHAVRVFVTSDNLVIDEFHGDETHLLADLPTQSSGNGTIEVIIEWSSDNNITSPEHIYDACAQIIFADNHAGQLTCTGNYVFQ